MYGYVYVCTRIVELEMLIVQCTMYIAKSSESEKKNGFS